MRKHREKSEKRKKIVLSILISFLMIFSIFGVIASFNQRSTDDYSYNGFDFEPVDNQWVTEATTITGTKELIFLNHPLNVRVSLSQEIPTAIKNSPQVTIAFDPNMTDIQYVEVARFQLSQFLTAEYGKNVHTATTKNSTSYTFPVMTCESQENQNNLFITFTSSNTSSATMNGNCIELSAFNPIDYIQYSDSIMYHILGVLP